jgi:hypothetical protein
MPQEEGKDTCHPDLAQHRTLNAADNRYILADNSPNIFKKRPQIHAIRLSGMLCIIHNGRQTRLSSSTSVPENLVLIVGLLSLYA